jgi:hypothetical protein
MSVLMNLVSERHMEMVNELRKALSGLNEMSVEFLVPAGWLTVSGTAVKTRTYKIDPGSPAVTILASPFIAPHLPAFKARITT